MKQCFNHNGTQLLLYKTKNRRKVQKKEEKKLREMQGETPKNKKSRRENTAKNTFKKFQPPDETQGQLSFTNFIKSNIPNQPAYPTQFSSSRKISTDKSLYQAKERQLQGNPGFKTPKNASKKRRGRRIKPQAPTRFPSFRIQLYKRETDQIPYGIIPEDDDYNEEDDDQKTGYISYEQLLVILQREFPLTDFGSEIKIRYLHPALKSYFLLKPGEDIFPDDYRDSPLVLMLNIPRHDHFTKKNKKWHEKNPRVDVGAMSRRVDYLENLVEELRVALYNVMRYGFISDSLSKPNLSTMRSQNTATMSQNRSDRPRRRQKGVKSSGLGRIEVDMGGLDLEEGRNMRKTVVDGESDIQGELDEQEQMEVKDGEEDLGGSNMEVRGSKDDESNLDITNNDDLDPQMQEIIADGILQRAVAGKELLRVIGNLYSEEEIHNLEMELDDASLLEGGTSLSNNLKNTTSSNNNDFKKSPGMGQAGEHNSSAAELLNKYSRELNHPEEHAASLDLKRHSSDCQHHGCPHHHHGHVSHQKDHHHKKNISKTSKISRKKTLNLKDTSFNLTNKTSSKTTDNSNNQSEETNNPNPALKKYGSSAAGVIKTHPDQGSNLYNFPTSLKKPSKSFHQPQKKRQNKFRTHVAVLYSSPLVVKTIKRSGQESINMMMNDPVDYIGECSSILKLLNSSNKKLNVHIECANSDQLAKLIRKKPKVLHISCHGDFDPESQEYFLEFENNQAELFRLTPSILRDLFKNDDLSEIEVMFVNACHSEEVAKVFMEFGVGCLIVVEGQAKIDDSYAKEFSKLFYSELIYSKTINEAFEKAITQLRTSHINSPHSCCCGHNHKPDCLWYQEALRDGFHKAHYKHVPLCNCPKADKRIHSIDCEWALDFMYTYRPDYDFEGDEIEICCCSPEIPHDETRKLKLIYKDGVKAHGEKVVFKDLKYGKVNQSNKNFFFGTRFTDCQVLGQNRIIYKIFNDFAHGGVRVVYLKGDPGSGKSSIAKFVSNYLKERHKIDDVRYCNMEGINSVHVFMAKIPGNNSSAFDEVDFEGAGKLYDAEKSTLMVLDNMESLLENHFLKFQEKMLEVVEMTHLSFLILTSNQDFLKMDQKSIKRSHMIRYEKVYTVPFLPAQIGAKMLISMAKDYLPFNSRNPWNLQNHDVFKYSRIPIKIGEVAMMLRQGMNLDEITRMLKEKEEASNQENYQKSKIPEKERKNLNFEKKPISSTQRQPDSISDGQLGGTRQPECKSESDPWEELVNQLKAEKPQYFEFLAFIVALANGALLIDLIQNFKSYDKASMFEMVIRLCTARHIDDFEGDLQLSDECRDMLDILIEERDRINFDNVEAYSPTLEQRVGYGDTRSSPQPAYTLTLRRIFSRFIAKLGGVEKGGFGCQDDQKNYRKNSRGVLRDYDYSEEMSEFDLQSLSRKNSSKLSKSDRGSVYRKDSQDGYLARNQDKQLVSEPLLRIYLLQPHLENSPICLKANPALTAIYSKCESQAFWYILNIMQYFSSFYSSILHKIQRSRVYLENLVENSYLNSTVLWSGGIRINPSNYESCYIIQDKVSYEEVDKIIKFHQINLRSLLTGQSGAFNFQSVFDTFNRGGIIEGVYENTFISCLERLVFQVLTLYKANREYDACLEYAAYIRELYRTKEMQEKLVLLESKVELYVADIYLMRMKSLRRSELKKVRYNEINQQFKLIESLTDSLESSSALILRVEFLLTKYEILFTIWLRSKTRNSKLKSELHGITKSLLSLRKEIEADPKKSAFRFLKAKVDLRVILHNYHNEVMDIDEIQILTASLRTFKEFNSLKLVARAYLLLSKIYKNEPEMCLKYSREGLALAKQINEKKLIKQLKEFVADSKKEIRFRYHNTFIFMSCKPLRVNHGVPIQHAGLNLREDLRSLLLSDLKSYRKSLIVDFNRMTRTKLKNLFLKSTGCKLLVFDNYYSSEGGLIVEGEHLQFEEISLEELFDFEGYSQAVGNNNKNGEKQQKSQKFMRIQDPGSRLTEGEGLDIRESDRGKERNEDSLTDGSSESELNIDIFVSLNNKSRSLAECMQDNGVKLCIFFDFDSKEPHFTDLFTTYIQNMFKYLWLRKFVNLIVSNCSVLDSVENAKIDAAEELAHQVRTEYKMIEASVTNYKKSSKLTNFPDFEHLFDGCISILKSEEYVDGVIELSEGQLEDTSTIEYFKLEPLKQNLICRDKLIVKMYDELLEGRAVNLHAERGMGRSTFLKHFRHEMVLRSHIFPDGVFLFPIKQLYRNYVKMQQEMLRVIDLTNGSQFDRNLGHFSPYDGTRARILSSHDPRMLAGSVAHNPLAMSPALGGYPGNEEARAELTRNRTNQFSSRFRASVTVKDLIKSQFNQRFEHNMTRFFKDKKMLIIFDDYDFILESSGEYPSGSPFGSEGEHSHSGGASSNKKTSHQRVPKDWPSIRYPTYLLRALEKSPGVRVIFSTCKPFRIPEPFKAQERLQLPRMDFQQSLILLLASPFKVFIKFKKLNIEALYESSVMARSEGNPRKLHNMCSAFIQNELKFKKFSELKTEKTQNSSFLDQSSEYQPLDDPNSPILGRLNKGLKPYLHHSVEQSMDGSMMSFYSQKMPFNLEMDAIPNQLHGISSMEEGLKTKQTSFTTTGEVASGSLFGGDCDSRAGSMKSERDGGQGGKKKKKKRKKVGKEKLRKNRKIKKKK